MKAAVREGKREAGAKFADYFDFSEPLTKLPGHRILALMRGENEEALDLTLVADPAADPASRAPGVYELAIAHRFGVADRGRPGDRWLLDTVRWAWRTKIELQLRIDLRLRLWTQAEDEAVRVFGANLRDLLLAAPAGARATMGLDPGFRTGVKVAVVDATGKVVATTAIYPHEPQRRWDESLATLAALCATHSVELIAIGNGTASRETDRLAADLLKKYPDIKATKVVVSEAGASVYSASAYAAQELPELDVTLRGAVSIARRLQDPLAELVKIEPKAIGVGQYQHDVSEGKLGRSLDGVVEDCVNAVGVDVNTASAKLLARVSGVGDALAQSIVLHRDANGAFRTREALKEVPRLGPRAFELSAGFLRINDGDDPLDRSGVHPEAYPVVRRIAETAGVDVRALIGNARLLSSLKPAAFVDATFGLPTVTDILKELEKPGRDPRPAFRTAEFKEGVETIGDLKAGMILEGVVTNVAAFGAFVDIGVHQDGLVHVSAMSKTFVKDPRAVAKPGDIVNVKVLEVDAPAQTHFALDAAGRRRRSAAEGGRARRAFAGAFRPSAGAEDRRRARRGLAPGRRTAWIARALSPQQESPRRGGIMNGFRALAAAFARRPCGLGRACGSLRAGRPVACGPLFPSRGDGGGIRTSAPAGRAVRVHARLWRAGRAGLRLLDPQERRGHAPCGPVRGQCGGSSKIRAARTRGCAGPPPDPAFRRRTCRRLFPPVSPARREPDRLARVPSLLPRQSVHDDGRVDACLPAEGVIEDDDEADREPDRRHVDHVDLGAEALRELRARR